MRNRSSKLPNNKKLGPTLKGYNTGIFGSIVAVKINGKNIHSERDAIQGVIGHVSQDDLLIEELTVYENLFYNAPPK